MLNTSSGHQKWLKKPKVEAFILSVKNEDLLNGVNLFGKSLNVNENITGLQIFHNLTPSLKVQYLFGRIKLETQNLLNDRYVCDLNDPGCWHSEITHNIRIEIVSLGVKRNTHQEFPANNENP
ncbi:hypothetical protein QTP88_009056 [Uroleucon formosanum]